MEYLTGKTRVVGNWQPSNLDKETIFVEFQVEVNRIFDSSINSLSGMTIRNHADYAYLKERQDFHIDCPPKLTEQWLLVWSNFAPTLVLFADGSLLKAMDGDIILIDNSSVKHRAPEDFFHPDRWLARLGDLKPGKMTLQRYTY